MTNMQQETCRKPAAACHGPATHRRCPGDPKDTPIQAEVFSANSQPVTPGLALSVTVPSPPQMPLWLQAVCSPKGQRANWAASATDQGAPRPLHPGHQPKATLKKDDHFLPPPNRR